MSYSHEDIERFKNEKFYPKSKRAKDVKHELGYFGLNGDQRYNRIKRIVAEVCRRAEEQHIQSREPGTVAGNYWNPTDGSGSITDEMRLYEDVEKATSIPRFYVPWFINNHLRGIGRIHNPRGMQGSGGGGGSGGGNGGGQVPPPPTGIERVPSPTESEEAFSPVIPGSPMHGNSLAPMMAPMDARRDRSGDRREGGEATDFWKTVI